MRVDPASGLEVTVCSASAFLLHLAVVGFRLEAFLQLAASLRLAPETTFRRHGREIRRLSDPVASSRQDPKWQSPKPSRMTKHKVLKPEPLGPLTPDGPLT